MKILQSLMATGIQNNSLTTLDSNELRRIRITNSIALSLIIALLGFLIPSISIWEFLILDLYFIFVCILTLVLNYYKKSYAATVFILSNGALLLSLINTLAIGSPINILGLLFILSTTLVLFQRPLRVLVVVLIFVAFDLLISDYLIPLFKPHPITLPVWLEYYFIAFMTIGIVFNLSIYKKWKNQNAITLRSIASSFQNLDEELQKTRNDLTLSKKYVNRIASKSAHDLRTPIRTLNSYISLIKLQLDTAYCPAIAEYIQYIDRSAKDILDIADKMVYFFALDAQNQDSNENCDLNQLVNNSVELLKQKLGIEINLEKELLPNIISKFNLLNQLIYSVIENSIIHNLSEVPLIRVTSYETNQKIHLLIHDNGIGINPLHREDIFKEFNEVKYLPNRSGAGLGLAICKKIAHFLSGDIHLVDSDYSGSTFGLTFDKIT